MRIASRAALCAAVSTASFALLSSSTQALGVALPISYTVQLQARASVGTGASTFNLPAGSSFSSNTPDINDGRQIVFKTTTSSTSATSPNGFWVGQANAATQFGSGSLKFTAPDNNGLISDPTINNTGDAAFPMTGASSGNGMYKYSASSGTAAIFTTLSAGASSWGSTRI